MHGWWSWSSVPAKRLSIFRVVVVLGLAVSRVRARHWLGANLHERRRAVVVSGLAVSRVRARHWLGANLPGTTPRFSITQQVRRGRPAR